MISQFRTKLFFIGFLLSFMFTMHSQNKNLELINASLLLLNSVNSDCDCNNCLAINQPFYKGKIILKDSTILIGEIRVNQPFDNKLVSIFYTNEEYSVIANKKIKEIIFTAPDVSKETKFISIIDDDVLYRQIYKKDSSLSVYDSSSKPFHDKLVGKVYIEENSTLIDTWNFWSSSSKKDVINYLNERDATNYKNRDFKSLDQLFAKL